MAKLHSPFIKGVTEKYDEIYSISQLQYDEDNYKLYLDNDDDHVFRTQNSGDREFVLNLGEQTIFDAISINGRYFKKLWRLIDR